MRACEGHIGGSHEEEVTPEAGTLVGGPRGRSPEPCGVRRVRGGSHQARPPDPHPDARSV